MMRKTGFIMLAMASAAVSQKTPPPAGQSTPVIPTSASPEPIIDPTVVAAANAAAEAGGTGPYKAEMVTDPGLPTHTLYRPRNMAAAGKLPILSWGNGACVNIGNRFRYFLTEVASHGYLILAVGPKGEPEVEWKVRLPNSPSPRDLNAKSQASQLTDAIDWAVAENARKGSPYYGRLNINKIAVAGQSCGGLQAISAAADPRVKTLMVLNSGTFADSAQPLAGTGGANKASLLKFHTPVAYISGDESDVAYKNSNSDFVDIKHVPVFRAWQHGVGHSAHYRTAGGASFGPVAAAWLDWQLKGDTKARAWFVGKNCRLCKDAGWTVKKKGIE